MNLPIPLLPAALEAPHGAVLEFTVVFAVILFGPVIMERARIPGLIGLLFGGFLIGPHALEWIGAGNQTIPELGQLGLLFLMFLAGLELDLRVLAANRRVAVIFGLMTFVAPFAAGWAIGAVLGWSTPASVLLGSLLASHTLVLYPMVRDSGLAGNRAVASAVGATVLTDTIALVVLAVVAGTTKGTGSAGAVLGTIGLGLAALGVAGVLLPRLASAALRLWGGDRVARFLIAVLGFLAMAMLAEVFGIEGIVGAFFAGLALNRLFPNEGPAMGRVEFVGAAVFVPMFLVSVGLLLDPSVMFTGEALALAGLITVGCLGGKALAAWVAQRVFGFTGSEAGVVYVLTSPQAAATLAATLVGFEIGLFSETVVNAVLMLILVSIVVATVTTKPFAARVAPSAPTPPTLGERVMLIAPRLGPSDAAMHVVERLARSDGGVAEVVVSPADHETPLDPSDLRGLEVRTFSRNLDGTVRAVAERALPGTVIAAVVGAEPSVVVIDATRPGIPATVADRLAEQAAVPVVVLTGDPAATVGGGTGPADGVAREVADRLGGEGAGAGIVLVRSGDQPADTADGAALTARVIEPARAQD